MRAPWRVIQTEIGARFKQQDKSDKAVLLRFVFAHLHGEVAFVTQFLDEMHLCLEPIDVIFFVFQQRDKEVARAMQVGEETVKWHVKNLFVKLSADTRKQAVRRAQLLGLLEEAP